MKDTVKRTIQRRLGIIAGQVKGLEKMIEADAYCIDVITQTSAVRHALSSIEDVMLKNHLATHVVEQIKSGKKKKPIEEILAVYKLSKKK